MNQTGTNTISTEVGTSGSDPDVTTSPAPIRVAIERLESTVARRSGFGVGTSHSVTTLDDGLRCSSVEGPWTIGADLGPALGGTATAPTPGMLLRAALGCCMAMTYRLRAERRGVRLTSVKVSVEADSELAGMLSIDSPAPPGYSEVRYHVEVESPDDPAQVLAVLDEGDRLSPVLDVFSRANSMRRTTDIRSSDKGAGKH